MTDSILGIILMVVSYFIGCISPATIVAKANGIDIRKEGSGNPGTTNVLRTLGKKAAAVTLITDVLKGAVPVIIGAFAGPVFAFGCGTMAMIGHVWPFQFRFKGGKGVATGIGVVLAVNPLLGVMLLVIFAVVVAITGYVSLGSCIAAFIMPALALVLMPDFFWFAVIIAAIIIIKHRANLARIVRGEESKLHLGKQEGSL